VLGKNRVTERRVKLPAVASDMKKSVAEILDKPVSELADKADQKTLAL